MLLGKRIKELRLERKLTQQELVDMVNVTKVSICCYENGTRTPTLETLFELEKVFNVDLNYLLGSDTEVSAPKKRVRMAKEEVEFIKEIRNYKNLYELVIENPKRCVELINKKLKF